MLHHLICHLLTLHHHYTPPHMSPETSFLHNQNPEPQPLESRKSHGQHKTLDYLNDYIYTIPNLKPNTTHNHASSSQTGSCLSLNALISVNDHISPEVPTPASQSLVRNVCHNSESSSYEGSIQSYLANQGIPGAWVNHIVDCSFFRKQLWHKSLKPYMQITLGTCAFARW